MSSPVDLALALAYKTENQLQEMTKRVDKQSLLVRQLQTQVRNTKIGCGLGIIVAMGYTAQQKTQVVYSDGSTNSEPGHWKCENGSC